ncbi:hypothetical protein ILYODFUR_034672, partial [Ilyodon furcidens]
FPACDLLTYVANLTYDSALSEALKCKCLRWGQRAPLASCHAYRHRSGNFRVFLNVSQVGLAYCRQSLFFVDVLFRLEPSNTHFFGW